MIVVVGSINLDFVFFVARLPRAGKTLMARGAHHPSRPCRRRYGLRQHCNIGRRQSESCRCRVMLPCAWQPVQLPNAQSINEQIGRA